MLFTWSCGGQEFPDNCFSMSQSDSQLPEDYFKLLQTSKCFQNTQVMSPYPYPGSSQLLTMTDNVEALLGAAAAGLTEDVCRLIAEGEDVNTRDCRGFWTPLMLALDNGQCEVAR